MKDFPSAPVPCVRVLLPLAGITVSLSPVSLFIDFSLPALVEKVSRGLAGAAGLLPTAEPLGDFLCMGRSGGGGGGGGQEPSQTGLSKENSTEAGAAAD